MGQVIKWTAIVGVFLWGLLSFGLFAVLGAVGIGLLVAKFNE